MNPSSQMLIRFWLLHMAVCATLWGWMLVVTLGLGFKDRSTWTAFDHFQAAVVPALASALTIPGRLFLGAVDNGYVFFGVMALNSLLWAFALTVTFIGIKRRAVKQ